MTAGSGVKWEERGWDPSLEAAAFLAGLCSVGRRTGTPTKQAEPLLESAGHFVHRGVRLTLKYLQNAIREKLGSFGFLKVIEKMEWGLGTPLEIKS